MSPLVNSLLTQSSDGLQLLSILTDDLNAVIAAVTEGSPNKKSHVGWLVGGRYIEFNIFRKVWTRVLIPIAAPLNKWLSSASKIRPVMARTKPVKPLFVSNITSCPSLPPRFFGAKSVHDLRPDDIKYVMALGDSITAGFFAKGKYHGHPLTIKNLKEHRGVSFAMGGDKNAESLANFIKFYRRDVIGASVGSHLVEICAGNFCPDNRYKPFFDRLNAAQSGAMATNLEHEMRYLLNQLAKYNATRKDYKFLNLFMGSNDICNICTRNYVAPLEFEKNIRKTLESIRRYIPNTVVNLMGVFNVSQVYEFSHGKEYCRWFKDLPQVQFGCPCAFLPGQIGKKKRQEMDKVTVLYKSAIERIAMEYAQKHNRDPSFAVVYQPIDVNLTTFPIEAVSNIDCFHPSLNTHALMAKSLWNNLPITSSLRSASIKWNPELPIRCFTATDRIRTLGN
ncbi:hypothetical protein G9A89_015308 [Geosiphon pyriformis]|nr:hypothetical protein G9A89_015308 [Geosiphon pyriformis]